MGELCVCVYFGLTYNAGLEPQWVRFAFVFLLGAG